MLIEIFKILCVLLGLRKGVMFLSRDISQRMPIDETLEVVVFSYEEKYNILGRVNCCRNVYALDADGNVIWRIFSDYDADGGYFSEVYWEGEELRAWRFDCWVYSIDLSTGKAIPHEFLK